MIRRNGLVLLAAVLFLLLPSISHAATAIVEGGTVELVNGTPYAWRKTDVRNDRMRQWNFPDVIPTGATATATVEFSLYDRYPSGEVTFSLEGTGLSFKVAGRTTVSNFEMKVELTSVELPGYPAGSVFDLNFVPEGVVTFMLAGQPGSFISNLGQSAWMHDNLDMLGSRSLRHLCIPGSHDAGMSVITGGTFLASPCNTLTQHRPMLGQLQMGMRYFDLRPVISGGKFYTGHYSDLPTVGWQGNNGQSLASIITDVNTFTADNQELIVLHFSHDLNTDVGRIYRPFTQKEWNSLITMLTGLHSRVTSISHPNLNRTTVDLTTLKLADLIGDQPAVLIVAEPADSSITINTSAAAEGVFKVRNFPIFNQYSATNDVQTMMNDQRAKLQAQRPNPDAGYFLLSWTLTQNDWQAASCNGSGWTNSILALADVANQYLRSKLLQFSNPWTYPNILYVDGVRSSDIAGLAMDVNRMVSTGTPREYVIYKGSGSDNGIYVATSPDSNLSNGTAWGLTRMNVAINTSDTPGIIFFAGRMYVLYKGAGIDTRIHVAQPGADILDGNAWAANPLPPAINTSTAPTVAVLNDTPYMLYKGAGSDTNVYVARPAGNRVGDGNSWSAQRLNPGINTSNAPAVAEYGGVLYLFYKGSGDSNIWVGRSSGDVFNGNTWTANRLNPLINTSAAPGTAVYKGDLYLFYKGSGGDTNIYIARSRGRQIFDGASWEYARLNPGINTTAAPKPVVIGDSLYLFYKGSGDDNIWIAQPLSADAFNGDAWRWDRLNPAIRTSTGPGAAMTW